MSTIITHRNSTVIHHHLKKPTYMSAIITYRNTTLSPIIIYSNGLVSRVVGLDLKPKPLWEPNQPPKAGQLWMG